MALLDGKTPQEIAKDIVKEAVEPILVEIDGVQGQNLDELVRYKFSKKIYSKGEKWFRRNVEHLRTEFLETVIAAMYKQRVKADLVQQEKDNLDYFKTLVSRGMSVQDAAIEAGLAAKPTEPVAKQDNEPTAKDVEDAIAAATEAVKAEETKKKKSA